ncbi:hypothetical protein D3C75_1284890 [compost metagenome]
MQMLLSKRSSNRIDDGIIALQIFGGQGKDILFHYSRLPARHLRSVPHDRCNLMSPVQRFLHNLTACFAACSNYCYFHCIDLL